MELIHLYVHLKQEPPGGSVLLTWFRNGQVTQRQVVQLAGGDTFPISLYDAKQPSLPAGDRWVTIKAGATVVGSLRFTIGR